ncbi:hypothetical protein GCM10023238_35030 [Streptomyces heliomycini]
MTESFDWNHGVFLGANVASEKTAAAEGKVGELRRDPFAMLPFCGYNMGDYMAHWIDVAKDKDQSKLPRIYYVNWFRKDDAGRFVWPGFGENSRVLKWIVERLEGTAEGVETPIGVLPAKAALDTEGLDLSDADLDFLLTVDRTCGARRPPWSPTTSTPSATTRPRSCGTSTTRWWSAWADARTDPAAGRYEDALTSDRHATTGRGNTPARPAQRRAGPWARRRPPARPGGRDDDGALARAGPHGDRPFGRRGRRGRPPERRPGPSAAPDGPGGRRAPGSRRSAAPVPPRPPPGPGSWWRSGPAPRPSAGRRGRAHRPPVPHTGVPAPWAAGRCTSAGSSPPRPWPSCRRARFRGECGRDCREVSRARRRPGGRPAMRRRARVMWDWSV